MFHTEKSMHMVVVVCASVTTWLRLIDCCLKRNVTHTVMLICRVLKDGKFKVNPWWSSFAFWLSSHISFYVCIIFAGSLSLVVDIDVEWMKRLCGFEWESEWRDYVGLNESLSEENRCLYENDWRDYVSFIHPWWRNYVSVCILDEEIRWVWTRMSE